MPVKLCFFLQLQTRSIKFEKESDIYSLGLVLFEILLYSTKRHEGFKKQFQDYLQEAPFVNPAEFKEKCGLEDLFVDQKVRK